MSAGEREREREKEAGPRATGRLGAISISAVISAAQMGFDDD